MYDIKQCADCHYSAHFNGVICCDYILIEEHRRGCYGNGRCEKFKKRDVPYSRKFLKGLLNEASEYFR